MTFGGHKFNESVFQTLFALDAGDADEKDLTLFLMQNLRITRKFAREAYFFAKGVFDRSKLLDELIAKASQAYDFERIGKVERAVLRWSVYHQNSSTSLSSEVVTEEAFRLTKKFSTKEAATFVLAVLNTVKQEKAYGDKTFFSTENRGAS